DLPPDLIGAVAERTGGHQPPRRRQPLKSGHEPADIFTPLDRAYVKNDGRTGDALNRVRSRAVRDQVYAAPLNSQDLLYLAGGKRRDRDDGGRGHGGERRPASE